MSMIERALCLWAVTGAVYWLCGLTLDAWRSWMMRRAIGTATDSLLNQPQGFKIPHPKHGTVPGSPTPPPIRVRRDGGGRTRRRPGS